MKLQKISSNWHTWIGAILSIPILIVGITAIFLSHKDSFSVKEIEDQKVEKKYEKDIAQVEIKLKEIKAVAVTNNITWIGTKKGLFKVEDGQKTRIFDFSDDGIIQLAINQNKLIVLSKKGLYFQTQKDDFEKKIEGDFASLTVIDNLNLVLVGKDGLYKSKNSGDNWEVENLIALYASTESNSEIQKAKKVKTQKLEKDSYKEKKEFKKIVKDLHTGKFLGKKYMWVWGDIVGGACVLLVLTGLFMWYKKSRDKKKLIAKL
jgi:hypothetical protein